MSEQQDDKVVDKPEDKAPENKAPELTSMEQKALEMGWRPHDEFDGDEDDFIDAKEFVRRKPLFEKIENTTKELKQVRKALELFKQHYSTVKETEYNRAMTALKTARKEALESGDGDRFEVIDAEIKQVEKQVTEIQAAKNAPIVQDEPAFPPEFTAWKDRNRWYDSKRYMKAFADDIGTEMHKRGMTPVEVLKEVEKEVRKKFPDEFTNPRKASAPDVDTSRASGGPSKDSDEKGLSATERQIMNTLVRGGHITKEKYLADLRAIKEQK